MLRGIQVLDLSDERGFLAGKILGDMGADVVKVEPPGGDPARQRGPFLGGIRDPERSLGWLAMNTSKRGVVLDLDASADQERFRALARGADVVLETCKLDTRRFFHAYRIAPFSFGTLVLERGSHAESATSLRELLTGRGVSHLIDCGNLDVLLADERQEAAFVASTRVIARYRSKRLLALRR